MCVKKADGGTIKYGDNVIAKIVAKWILSLDNGKIKIENDFYVEGLKHNLLSVSQMCDQEYNLTFHAQICEIMKASIGKLVAQESAIENNLYNLSEIK